jgi:hypothetical protein
LVKWKGYSKSQATWEPLSNLRNVKPMIEAYEVSYKKKSNGVSEERSNNPKEKKK